MANETAPKPAQVDALVREYAAAQAVVLQHKNAAKLAEIKQDELKERLVTMVQSFGARHAEKSMRLEGFQTKATVTVGSRFTTDAEAVERFRAYLEEKTMPEISGRIFRSHVSYSLVEGPQEVLAKIDMPTRIRTKLAALLAVCFKVVTNAPNLKVEIAEPEMAKK